MSRVFITGSADGLGLAAAGLLLQQGHQVVGHARSQGRAEDLRAALPVCCAPTPSGLLSCGVIPACMGRRLFGVEPFQAERPQRRAGAVDRSFPATGLPLPSIDQGRRARLLVTETRSRASAVKRPGTMPYGRAMMGRIDSVGTMAAGIPAGTADPDDPGDT